MKFSNETLKNIINNKRLKYIFGVSILLLFCCLLNITFSLFTTGVNNMSANITVGDLDYKMVINEVNEDFTVGIKDQTNTIKGDRILLSKAGEAEQFDISLHSLNFIDTKYEIIYNVCSDVNCTSFIDKPEEIQVFYDFNNPEINGLIYSSSSKEIGIIVVNNTENDYYIQVGLNVGYASNELVLKNQINEYFTTDLMGAHLNIVAYVNGQEVTAFPSTPNYEVSFSCKYNNGQTASAQGIYNYTDNGWKFDISNIDSSPTTCRIDFEEILQLTYDVMLSKYNCANKSEQANDPIITYTGNCSLHQDNNNNWYMKLLSNGELVISREIWIDVFLVGGGAGGAAADYYNGGAGGGGGENYTSYNIQLLNTSTYNVTIGKGGGSAKNGGATSMQVLNSTLSTSGGTAGSCENGGDRDSWAGGGHNGGNGANGVRAFGGTTNDNILYGACGGGGGATSWDINPWPGSSGAGGTTGGGAGGAGGEAHRYGSEGESATVANVGAGGGGGGAGSQAGGSGSTGVVIIRNAR